MTDTDDLTGPVALECNWCGHWEKGHRTKDQIAAWLRVHRRLGSVSTRVTVA